MNDMVEKLHRKQLSLIHMTRGQVLKKLGKRELCSDYEFTIEQEYFYKLFQKWYSTVSCNIFKAWDKKKLFMNLQNGYLPSFFNTEVLRKQSRLLGRGKRKKLRIQFMLSDFLTEVRKRAPGFHCEFENDVTFKIKERKATVPCSELSFTTSD